MNLQSLLEWADFDTRKYSGRGMWGKYCLAIYVSSIDNIFADVLEALADNFHSMEAKDVREISQEFRGMKTDSMGTGYVVYWPNTPFDGEESA